MTTNARCEVAIAGGGFAGLGLALALARGLGPSFRVVVCDPAFARPASNDARASAFAAGARRLLEAVGVWPAVAGEAQPILDMVITDSRARDATRPVFLTFAGEVEPGEPFAHMVENRLVLDALVAAARDAGIDLRSTTVSGFADGTEEILARLADGTALAARLLVAADGAASRLREHAGIPVTAWAYGQSGIVATLGHERDHDGRAEEHFLPAGPFAFLPLPERRGSIVWTERGAAAERMCELPPDLFVEEVTCRMGRHLGALTLLSKPRAFPLRLQLARAFWKGRVALLGDAAHVIHPIAGQGLNMGLRDVAALAESVADAARLGLDVGSPDVMERYARWRRFDTLAMAATTDVLNRLFSNDIDPLRLVRDVGLGLVDRMPALKRFFVGEAAGVAGDAPKLLRGEMV
jgi:2-octaprenyl-6-methoxyphenol hydroxylase